ncbi:hypothetical protein ACFLXT_04065 [Chloroflexota bacterium]
MIDKGLDKILVGFFGTVGMAILIFVWTQPMPLTERLLTIAFGAIGLLWASIRVLSWKSRPAEMSVVEGQTEVEV